MFETVEMTEIKAPVDVMTIGYKCFVIGQAVAIHHSARTPIAILVEASDGARTEHEARTVLPASINGTSSWTEIEEFWVEQI
jgi:hypothetical protein